MLRRRVAILSLFAFILVAGCGGVNEKTLTDAQNRIDALKTKGVPDDELSGARVYLYQAKDHKTRGNSALAKQAADSMKVNLERAEKVYQEKIATLGPKIESLKAEINKAKAEVSGLNVKKLDSCIAIIDSFVKMDWKLQASNKAQEIVAILPGVKEDEAKSKELRKKIPGEWVCVTVTKSEEVKEVNAVEKKIFTFYKDGKVKLVENKKGQSGPYLKENWEFLSNGTYDFVGDTVVLKIARFAAVKQDFERIHKIDGKPVWKKEPGPTYDSTITDGSQDRFITFADLKVDFKQAKKF